MSNIEMRLMMKKKILIMVLAFMLMIPCFVKAEEKGFDLYKAYKVNLKGANPEYELSNKMTENPPKSITLKVTNYSFESMTLPLDGTIKVNLGESASYNTKFDFEWDKHQYKFAVNLVAHYEKTDSGAGSLSWDVNVDYNGPLYDWSSMPVKIIELGEKKLHKTTYDSGLVTHNDYVISLRTEQKSNLGAMSFELIDISFNKTGDVSSVIDTIASGSAGETAAAIITVIILGILGAGAATVGVAGAKEETSKNEEEETKYKMVVYKNFGDKIKVGDKPGVVEARMIEISDKGEIDRTDLTKQIEIFSKDNVIAVSSPAFKKNAMTASVNVPNKPANSRARISNLPDQKEGIISFRFVGEGGQFQNNVKFNIVSEGQIKLENNELKVLGTSDEQFELGYELVDFIIEPKVELRYKSKLFELSLDKNKQGKNIIVAKATEEAKEKAFEKFIHEFPCEIIAKNEKETVTEKFELQLCYEGIGTAYEKCNNNETPEQYKIHCFSDQENDKREEKAARIPLCVMRWDEASKNLMVDDAATNNLNFEFILSDSKKKNAKALNKVIEDAKIVAKVDSANKTQVKVDLQYQSTIFMIYPSKNTTAPDPEIDLKINVSMTSAEFKTLTLEIKLIPQVDFKAMITWLIEYGRGTYVDKFIQIGNIATYHGALDFIENRVYSKSNCPYTPKKVDGKIDNHYEDGRYDVSRPTYVFLLDNCMPHQIGDFSQIQSLHHELCHTIEHQNGDTAQKNGERHSYFIQHLVNVVHVLSDIERGKLDVKSGGTAIQAYYNVFYNDTNADPQTFSWFGVKFVSPSMLLGRYAEFEHYGPASVPEERKAAIANYFRQHYFPANIHAKKNVGAFFKETNGPFKNAVWNINGTENFVGMFSGITLKHPDYDFESVKPAEWIPGTLTLKTTFRITNNKTKVTELIEVQLDGGKLEYLEDKYQIIDKFTVSWKSLDKISDTALGKANIKTEAVVMK